MGMVGCEVMNGTVLSSGRDDAVLMSGLAYG